MKYKFTLIACFVVLAFSVVAQTNTKSLTTSEKKITVSIISLTNPPNGYEAFYNHLTKNLDTTLASLKSAPVGYYEVGVVYFIDKEGNITRITTPIDPGFGTTDEVIRVLRKYHDHVPIIKNGKPIEFRVKQIIQFIVSDKSSLDEKTKLDTSNRDFKNVQVEAMFPGGPVGWKMYLESNLNQNVASEHGAPPGRYIVTVSFLVEKDGTIIEALIKKDTNSVVQNNNDYGVADEAIRVLKNSPKWRPAIQDGKTVKYRGKQSITFVVSEEQPLYKQPQYKQSINSQENNKDYDKVFTSAQIEAEFPGGPQAWKRFLERNLNVNVPGDKGAPAGRYTVIVSFLVDKNGNVSDITADNNPGYGTVEETIRVIKNGPPWKPAVQNGHNVAYRARQAITFMVSKDK